MEIVRARRYHLDGPLRGKVAAYSCHQHTHDVKLPHGHDLFSARSQTYYPAALVVRVENDRRVMFLFMSVDSDMNNRLPRIRNASSTEF